MIPTNTSRVPTLPMRDPAPPSRGPYHVCETDNGYDVVASDGQQVGWFLAQELAHAAVAALNRSPE